MTDLVALKKRFRELYKQQLAEHEAYVTRVTSEFVTALMGAIESDAVEMGSSNSFYVELFFSKLLDEEIREHVLDDAVPEAMKKLGFDGHLSDIKNAPDNKIIYIFWFSFTEGVGDE